MEAQTATGSRGKGWRNLLACGVLGGLVAALLLAVDWMLWLWLNAAGPTSVVETLQEVGWAAFLLGVIPGALMYLGHAARRHRCSRARMYLGALALVLGVLAWSLYAATTFVLVGLWVTG